MNKRQRAPPCRVAPAPAQRPSPDRPGLSRARKALFAVVAVAFGLGLLEGMLALMGVQPDRFERDPYVGFSGRLPLFDLRRGPRGELLRVTAQNRLDYFNAQQFPAVKVPGTCRIFSLGGSTTYGHPYNDTTSFNGWVRALLTGLYPERRWEVVNAGGISYASYRVAQLMEELIQYQPDLFLIYTGHNEFLERRIYGKVTRLPAALRAARAALGRLRLTTLLQHVVDAAGRRAGSAARASTVLEPEVVTELEQTDGPSSYSRETLYREETLEHYRFNLERMVSIARSVGAQAIFVVPASNLREVAPFKSQHRAGLTDAQRQAWLTLYERARRDFYASAQPTHALTALAEAAAIDDLPAKLHFVRGRVLEKLERFPEARAAYERARDEDVCPLRALGAQRRLLEQVAAEQRVPLIDFEALLAAQSTHGLLDAKVFLDHVHPTIEGHRLLALEILRTMLDLNWIASPPPPAQVERVTRQMLAGVDTRAQSLALMRLCKTLGWAGRREEAYRAGTEAARLAPDLAMVRFEAGRAAQLVQHPDEAIAHYRRALGLDPRHAAAHTGLGVLLEDRGQLADAADHFRRALQWGRPKDAERDRANLARVLKSMPADTTPANPSAAAPLPRAP